MGRSLRPNAAGARRLTKLVGGDVHVFDVPFANGPAECLRLLSVICPQRRPGGRLPAPASPPASTAPRRHRVRHGAAAQAELITQGCNILAVRPEVVVMVKGDPVARRALLDRGCEVHTFPGDEVVHQRVQRPRLHRRPSCADEEPDAGRAGRGGEHRPGPPGRRPGRDRRDPEPDGDEGAVQTEVALRMTTTVSTSSASTRRPSTSRPIPTSRASRSRATPHPVVTGRLTGDTAGRLVLIAGRIDVISGGDELAWTSPPFRPRIEDGNLSRRGAST